ncbi:uncharacterized protein J3R85_013129 [Psidium guajava]|nr:uncharacterized protein J3R85_013129 [Psidium guajava]
MMQLLNSVDEPGVQDHSLGSNGVNTDLRQVEGMHVCC